MTDLVILSEPRDVVVSPGSESLVVAPGSGGGPPGGPGPPGANVMAIPSFETAHTQPIPLGTNRADTASWADGGQLGNGKYVRDAVIDSTVAAAYPSLIFQAPDEHGDQHYFRFGGERLTPLHLGMRDCINPRSSSEVAYDNKVKLAEMWAYGHYLQFTRNIRIELNFVPCQGVGTSEMFLMYGTTGASWWNSQRLNVVPGRIIAVAPAGMAIPTIEHLLKCSGKGIQVADGLQWELQGAPWGEVAAGYGHIIAKNLMFIEDAGGSNFGRVSAWGCRRHAVRFSDVTGNNISITLGDIDGNRCGNWGTSGDGKFNGTYESGSYVSALSDDYAQRHRITLVLPDSNVDPHDLEVNDPLDFNIVGGAARGVPAVVMAIVGYPAANKVTVDIYPCLEQTVSGTFRSMHGGGVDCRGGDLANSRIGAVRVSVGGTSVRLLSEYAPKIETVLGENVGCRVQVGAGGLEGLQGYRELVHHPENVLYDVLDFASSAFAYEFGSPSNMESSPEGRYGKVVRVEPAVFVAGVWHPPHRRTICGMSWDDAGGRLSSPGVKSVEANLNGSTEAVISNSLQYRCGSVHADTFTFNLISEPSEALVFRQVEAFAGPIYGTGANGEPTGTIRFQIDGFEVHPCTIFGGAGPVDLTAFTCPVLFHYTFELDPTGGDAHNWTVHAIPLWQGTPVLGGGGGLTDGDKGDVVVSGSGTVLTVESAAGDFNVVGNLTGLTPDAKHLVLGAPSTNDAKAVIATGSALAVRIEASGCSVASPAWHMVSDGMHGILTSYPLIGAWCMGSLSNHDTAITRWGDAKIIVKDTSVDLANGAVAIKIGGNQVVAARQTGTPADATDLATALTLLNALKAKLITHGLIS